MNHRFYIVSLVTIHLGALGCSREPSAPASEASDQPATNAPSQATATETPSTDQEGMDLSPHGIKARITVPFAAQAEQDGEIVVVAPTSEDSDLLEVLIEKQVPQAERTLTGFKQAREAEGYTILSESSDGAGFRVFVHKHRDNNREWGVYRYVTALRAHCSVGQTLVGFTSTEWEQARAAVEQQGRVCDSFRR